jgi:BlaI family transcriptional regulator, penicillinase repressor
MPRKRYEGGLGSRERQIMDVIYRLGKASVADVLAELREPPSYSAVRTMIRALEAKGLLQHRQLGTRYVYSPAHSRQAASRSALKHVMQTFFADSPTDTVAAILQAAATKLTDDDLSRLEQLIELARQEGK